MYNNKKWYRIFLILFAVICLYGCQKEPVEKDAEAGREETLDENIFDLGKMDGTKKIQANFSFGVHNFDEDKGQILYDGEELQIDFEVSPDNCSFECSVLIFIDGIIQKYALKPQGILCEQHTVNVENQETLISAYFTPQIDAGKKKHFIHFLCMFDSEFQPESGNISYGNSHKISQVMPWELVVNGKCKKTKEVSVPQKTKMISQEKKNEYKNDDVNNKNNSKLKTGIQFETEKGKKDDEIIFRILGGKAAKYRISAYVGHKLVKFSNGANYIDLFLDDKHMYESYLTVGKMTDKEYDTLYFMAIPISSLGTAMVEKSSSICLYHGGMLDA